LLSNKKIELLTAGLHLISLLSSEFWSKKEVQDCNFIKSICEYSKSHKTKTPFVKYLFDLMQNDYISSNTEIGILIINICDYFSQQKGQKL